MWEIFSNTCLCQHLLKSDMSDAVKDNTQNALMTVTIPPVVLNLSTKPKSSNKMKIYVQEAITHPQWTIIFLNKEGAIFLSSWLVMSESWASKPLVWSKLLGYGPLFSKHGRTNIDSCTTLSGYRKIIASWGEEQKAAHKIFCIQKSLCKSQPSE